MTLEDLVDAVKTTTKSYWKWILGAVIFFVVIYVGWKLYAQRNRIIALKAQRKALQEQAKDLEMKVKNTSDTKEAEMLVAEADALRRQTEKVDKEIADLELEYAKKEKAVADAKNWKELRRQAEGDG